MLWHCFEIYPRWYSLVYQMSMIYFVAVFGMFPYCVIFLVVVINKIWDGALWHPKCFNCIRDWVVNLQAVWYILAQPMAESYNEWSHTRYMKRWHAASMCVLMEVMSIHCMNFIWVQYRRCYVVSKFFLLNKDMMWWEEIWLFQSRIICISYQQINYSRQWLAA